MKFLVLLFVFSLFYFSQQQTIRVAIVSEVCSGGTFAGNDTCPQLATALSGSTTYSISASVVSCSSWTGPVIASSYDVVILASGGYPNPNIPSNLGRVVKDFVESYNGGLILTSWAFLAITSSIIYTPLNYVSPITFNGGYDYFSSASIQITNNTHPITQGLGNLLSTLPIQSLSCGSIISGSSSLGSIVSGTDANLCSSPGQTTQGIVVRDLGASGGRSAHLAPLYAGDNNTPHRSGAYEALIENTVFWVSGKKVLYNTQQQQITALQTTQQQTPLQTTQQQATAMHTTIIQTMVEQSTSRNSSINNGSIIGGVIGGILGLCLIIFIIIFIIIKLKKKKRRNIKNEEDNSRIELEEEKKQSIKESSQNIQTINYLNEKLEIIEEIGNGKFGEVFKGKLGYFFVACKKLKNEEISEIEKEAKTLSKLKHENIVSLIGIKEINNETFMVMEFMNGGDLLNYLRINDKILKEQDLFNFTMQITNGMKYLEENNIIHNDLAARNILCSNEINKMICKISDFGLSKMLEHYYYEQTKKNPIPIKWSAPEVIFKVKISTKSDVFSFGVVLFEIFSKGEEPWVGKSNEEVIEALRSNQRMKLPKTFGPPFIIDLINECWKEKPHERPTFKDLYSKLQIGPINNNKSNQVSMYF